ncbi:MAG: hypothetical protein HFJ80_08210 [Clostridiales bacterium]|nr:hypothetical protein [Clostridiales bacterium]
MDGNEAFERARLAGMLSLRRAEERGSIGVKQERSLHAILKYWLQPDDALHEQKLPCGLIADILDGDRVIEIQTGGFSRLRTKLERLLPLYPVTVVYPIPHRKRLIWMGEDGELSAPHPSPKKGEVWDVAPELVFIPRLLSHKNLTLRLMLLDMDEYRALDGWSRDKKRGSHRMERIPTALIETVDFQGIADYCRLLPQGLPDPFTSADVTRACRRRGKLPQQLLYVLHTSGAIIRTGKKSNAYLYRCKNKIL